MAMIKPGSALYRRKGKSLYDRSHHVYDYDDEDFYGIEPAYSSHQQRWSIIIAILVLMNCSLGYMHMRRRARRQSLDTVTLLTDETFSDHIASYPHGTLVNFFFTGCEPCVKVTHEFEEAARQLRRLLPKTSGPVSLVAVNVDHAPSTLQRFSVQRFPTLLWFRRGRLVRDAKPSVRDAATITEFVQESLEPAVIDFASRAEFDDALPQLRSTMTRLDGESRGKIPPFVVGFGRDPSVHDLLDHMGEQFRGVTAFLFVKEARDTDPAIVAYFRDAAADMEYKAGLNADDVQTWLEPLLSDGIV